MAPASFPDPEDWNIEDVEIEPVYIENPITQAEIDEFVKFLAVMPDATG
jgi:hypothetical protein